MVFFNGIMICAVPKFQSFKSLKSEVISFFQVVSIKICPDGIEQLYCGCYKQHFGNFLKSYKLNYYKYLIINIL